MSLARLAILLVFGIVLGVPFIFRPPEATPASNAATLVVITPHNEQIRLEFATAFDKWHREHFSQPAVIDWRQPGGTSEIRKQLNALYKKAIATGQLKPDGTLAYGTMPFDICFGGGSYEHDQLRVGVSDTPPGSKEPVTLSISVPAGFSDEEMKAWFGDNVIGSGFLYEPGDPKKNIPGQNWIGSALSGFGIVYNRDALKRLGLPEPANWPDLCDPRYSGWLALADPRASGSVETSFNSILDNFGWDEGWRILRDMCANSRSFANSSPKIPLDVSAGEAAAGLSIDYYGRYQSQAVMRPGETPATSRVGYIDPIGTTFIDADPITILRGGPNPELARRFVRFVLSDEGQALWQFPRRSATDTLGPAHYELRRMPSRKAFIDAHKDRFVDKVDPFELASKTPSKNWRSAIKPMMGAFAIDIHHDIRAAWDAMHEAEKRGASPDAVAKMKALFYAWPEHDIVKKNADGATTTQRLPFNEANYKAIRADWKDAEKDGRMNDIRIRYTEFFRANYREIVRIASESGNH